MNHYATTSNRWENFKADRLIKAKDINSDTLPFEQSATVHHTGGNIERSKPIIPPKHLLKAEVSLTWLIKNYNRIYILKKKNCGFPIPFSLYTSPVWAWGWAGWNWWWGVETGHTHFHRQFLCGQIRSDEVRTWALMVLSHPEYPPPSSQTTTTTVNT